MPVQAAPSSNQNQPAKSRGANAKWTKAEVDSLIDQLFQAKEDGNTAEGGFKSAIWGGIADSFNDPLKKKSRACESKWTRLKKDYKEIKWLREEVSGFGWNEDTQLVEATDEIWEELRGVNILFSRLVLLF
jgi:Myb/SANT-like DNA-binding domain